MGYLRRRMKQALRAAFGSRQVRIAAILSVFLLAACTNVGPKSIRNTRFNYNSAIVDTRNEQLLTNLVRLKYRDTPYFIEVSSIATQYVLGLGGSGTVGGIGDKPVGGAGGSIAYEERPTVTYMPLQGETFVNRLLSRLPMSVIVLLSHSGWRFDRLLRAASRGSTTSGMRRPQPDQRPISPPNTRASWRSHAYWKSCVKPTRCISDIVVFRQAKSSRRSLSAAAWVVT